MPQLTTALLLRVAGGFGPLRVIPGKLGPVLYAVLGSTRPLIRYACGASSDDVYSVLSIYLVDGWVDLIPLSHYVAARHSRCPAASLRNRQKSVFWGVRSSQFASCPLGV